MPICHRRPTIERGQASAQHEGSPCRVAPGVFPKSIAPGATQSLASSSSLTVAIASEPDSLDSGCLLIDVEAPDAATFQISPDEATRLNDVQANRVQVAFDINSATPITDANVRSMWRPGL